MEEQAKRVHLSNPLPDLSSHPQTVYESIASYLTAYMLSALATTRRTLIENMRAYPWSFVIYRLINALVAVVLSYFLYNVLFAGQTPSLFRTYAGTNDYLTFIVIGVAVFTYANGALLNVGRSLITERRIGTMESLFLSPIPNSAYLLGTMLQDFFLTTLEVLALLGISLLFGAHFEHTDWFSLICILLIGHLGFFGMSIILGAVMLYLRDTYLTQNTALAVLYLICGVLFPLQYLPAWVQQVASFVPLTQILILARNSALHRSSLQQQGTSLLFLLFLSLIYCSIGLLLIRKVRKIALEEALS